MHKEVTEDIKHYISREIIPIYDGFDAAHDRAHAEAVITESLALAKYYNINIDMVYVVAAYHDIGLKYGRENHHIESGRLLREDATLRKWFTNDEIITMAEAVEDHRASSERVPRSIYGRIVAEADRQINPIDILNRTVQYGFAHYPTATVEEHWQRLKTHMAEKYADGGYLKLYLPESRNAEGLAELRRIINNEPKMRDIFEKHYTELSHLGVRHANEDDMTDINDMISNSRMIMRANGNYEQWVNGYPSSELIKEDIESGHGYIIYRKDNKSNIGYFAFFLGDEPTYSNIYDGQWRNTGKRYGTIHRLSSKEGVHGIAKCCIDWCMLQTEELRSDTHENNIIVQHILEKSGFEYRGIIYVADGTPRKAYQWNR